MSKYIALDWGWKFLLELNYVSMTRINFFAVSPFLRLTTYNNTWMLFKKYVLVSTVHTCWLISNTYLHKKSTFCRCMSRTTYVGKHVWGFTNNNVVKFGYPWKRDAKIITPKDHGFESLPRSNEVPIYCLSHCCYFSEFLWSRVTR
jgi:hypothetical protein